MRSGISVFLLLLMLQFHQVLAQPVSQIFEEGVALLEAGQFAAAIEKFSKVIEARPDNEAAWYNRGLAHQLSRNFSGAEKDFSTAIGLFGMDAGFYLERGKVRLEMARHEEALSDFNAALAVDNNLHEALLEKGIAFYLLENYDSSRFFLQQYLPWNDQNPLVHFYLGLNDQKSAKATAALERFSKAIELKPGYEDAYSARGDVLLSQKEFAQAIADFEAALATASDKTPYLMMKKGAALIQIGKYKEAVEILSNSLSLNPAFTETYFQRGIAYFMTHEFENAIRDLSVVIADEPDNHHAYFYRGLAYERVNQPDLAIPDYERTIELNPANTQAKERLDLIGEESFFSKYWIVLLLIGLLLLGALFFAFKKNAGTAKMLIGVLFVTSLLGCKKEYEGDFRVYTIPAGSHRSTKSMEFVRCNEISVLVKFDDSAIYTTQNPENQHDLNKLTGFSDCGTHHHKNSARFTWRWLDGNLELHAYIYKNGVRTNTFLRNLQIDQSYSLHLSAPKGEADYLFVVEQDSFRFPRGCEKGAKYRLYPYFGGDEPAPHDIRILMQDV